MFHAETGGGNIEIGDTGGGAEMRTGSGRIDLGRISGGLQAETDGGGIVVQIEAGNFAASEFDSSRNPRHDRRGRWWPENGLGGRASKWRGARVESNHIQRRYRVSRLNH